jgi:hypothetical protein
MIADILQMLDILCSADILHMLVVVVVDMGDMQTDTLIGVQTVGHVKTGLLMGVQTVGRVKTGLLVDSVTFFGE